MTRSTGIHRFLIAVNQWCHVLKVIKFYSSETKRGKFCRLLFLFLYSHLFLFLQKSVTVFNRLPNAADRRVTHSGGSWTQSEIQACCRTRHHASEVVATRRLSSVSVFRVCCTRSATLRRTVVERRVKENYLHNARVLFVALFFWPHVFADRRLSTKSTRDKFGRPWMPVTWRNTVYHKRLRSNWPMGELLRVTIIPTRNTVEWLLFPIKFTISLRLVTVVAMYAVYL